MFFKNCLRHFKTVMKHKWLVFKLCCKAGIPWRGIVHDLSKFSPTEFVESAKYYQGGKKSPIPACKQKEGYSKAWLHHKGRNRHHVEYWYDEFAPDKTPVIPYKYTVEMLCDGLAAGMVYNGKNWNNNTQLEYWLRKKDELPVNEKISNLAIEVYTQVSKQGVDKTITKNNLKNLYSKYCS